MKRTIALSIVVVTTILISNQAVLSQGCVAVRPMSCSASGYVNTVGIIQEGQWQLSSSYRYFRSFRHFRGDHEEKHRVEEGTEVINVTHSVDLGVTYAVSNRVGLTLNVPIIYYDRSSLYEHYGNSLSSNPAQTRFHTGASGIGDMRFTADYWLFDPVTAVRGNISIGLGIKMPTGDADVQDFFHKRAADGSDSLAVRPVDQSIQLGDGGWGLNLQIQGFRSLFGNAALYFNGFYLFNPRNVNNTLRRGAPVNTNSITAFHSVADQYAARLGISYTVLPKTGLSASLGGRIEGIPSEDLIGKSEGYRRPGYIISIEPGISYNRKALNFTLSAPIALYRNRTQSYSDKLRTRETGVYRIGDAAFADYLVNLVISYQFGKKAHSSMSMPEKVTIPIESLK